MANVLDDFMVGLSNCDKVVVRLTGVGEREFSTKDIYEAIDKLQQQSDKPTTEINIDYYNELKAKANELDRRNNGVDVIDNCICDYCSSTVRKEWFYCPDCGTRLLWELD